jgi:hypothetical protein
MRMTCLAGWTALASLVTLSGCCTWCERHCPHCQVPAAPAACAPVCCQPQPCCPAPATTPVYPAPAAIAPPPSGYQWSQPQAPPIYPQPPCQ